MRRTATFPRAWLMPARTRASQVSPRSAWAGGSERPATSGMLIAAKSPALTHSAALTPHAAMTSPPIAGPIAKHSEKETLCSVLPASRSPSASASRPQRHGSAPGRPERGSRPRRPERARGPTRATRSSAPAPRRPRPRRREGRQYASNAETVELRRGGGADESRDQQCADPEASHRERAVGAVEDDETERDRPDPQPSSLSV